VGPRGVVATGGFRGRPSRPPARLCALALAALLAAGCGTGGLSKSGDPTAGKQLFLKTCGSCHTLSDAGTQGTIGPNLDDAFATDRIQGFNQSTIQSVVLGQIREPITNPPTGVPGMPANLVKGQDAKDVAAYVASVAGVGATQSAGSPAPPAAPPPAPPPAAAPPPAPPAGPPPATAGGGSLAAGKHVFETAGCTSCHTLADAGAHGTVGPNLDQKKPPKALVVDRVTHGKGVMPSFQGQLSPSQIDAVATYVSSVAGK
jgi:mono/diheme cytochrome c family protein